MGIIVLVGQGLFVSIILPIQFGHDVDLNIAHGKVLIKKLLEGGRAIGFLGQIDKPFL